MTVLPTSAMVRVFDFLDPVGLAVMARVSRSWRDLVYRNEPWQRFEFNIRPEVADSDIFVKSGSIPCDAHHIGTPSALCFQAWAQQPHIDRLPSAIVQTTDPRKYVQRLYTYWRMSGRPCIHVSHHHAAYVIRCASSWTALSPRDKQRFMYRVSGVFSTKESSAYEGWLLAQRSHLTAETGHAAPKPADLTPQQKTDPFLVLKHGAALMTYERSELLKTRLNGLVTSLDSSRIMLMRRGKHVFEENERRYKTHLEEMWSAAAFSTAPSDPLPVLVEASTE
jgi:hypothetical protein